MRRGKGGRQRIVPAGERAFSWIRLYLARTRPLLAAGPAASPEAPAPAGPPETPGRHPTPPSDSPLYLTGYGGAFSPGSLGHLVRRYLDRAGIEIPGSCHLLRHACATHMHDRGAPLRAIQRMLGHSRLDTTAIYTHVSTAKLLEIHARHHPHGDFATDAPPSRPPGNPEDPGAPGPHGAAT